MNTDLGNYFRILKGKLIGAGIPEEIAKKYCTLLERGIMPELAFDNNEMPTDDCFKTLATIYEIFYKNKPEPITEVEIKNFLSIPFSRVKNAKKRMADFFPDRLQEIDELYEKDIQIFYLKQDEVEYLYNLISGYVCEDERIWQIFKVSVKVGVFYTESRFEAVEDAVGQKFVSEVIYESVVNGWLLHPYYTDPIEAIKYLMTMFDGETICKVILENPEYLYLYKEDGFIELPEQKEKRNQEIQAIIKKYK